MINDDNASMSVTTTTTTTTKQPLAMTMMVMKKKNEMTYDDNGNSMSGTTTDRIPSTTPGAEPPRDARDSGSARSHSTHLETSSSNRP